MYGKTSARDVEQLAHEPDNIKHIRHIKNLKLEVGMHDEDIELSMSYLEVLMPVLYDLKLQGCKISGGFIKKEWTAHY